MQLPYFQSSLPILNQLQTKWQSILNPLLGNPLTQGIILNKIVLSSGSNTINHTLGRALVGWSIIRQRASASVYDNQDSNQMPTLTLILISSADVTVDLEVF
jgi:hypothetical protein